MNNVLVLPLRRLNKQTGELEYIPYIGADPIPIPRKTSAPASEAPQGNALPVVWARDMEPRLIAPGSLIANLFDAGAMSVIYGSSNTGKSFLAASAAFHVATGQEWFGRKIRKPGCVVYLAAEGGTGFINRVVVLRQHHCIAAEANIPLAVVPCPVDLLNPNADRDRIIALVREAAKASGQPVVLIVVDTLSRAMAGGNENAPEDMTGFIQNVDAIRAASEAHCLIVHHSGKDAARGARGHNSLRAATDTEIEIARIEGGEEKLAVAKVTKQRDMPGEDVFYFHLKGILLGHDEEGEAVTSAVAVLAEHAASETKEPLRRQKDMPALRLEKLVDVIARCGQRVNAPDHIPEGVRVTTIEAWKEALNDGQLIDGETPAARRMQFNRTREALQQRRAISIWKNYVWAVRD